VFHSRAAIDPRCGPRLSRTEFLNMMKESTLIDSDNESLGVACFQQSQMNPPKSSELSHIVFIEFVEASSRLSLKAIESYRCGLAF
jgi:hypothetical protein